MWQSRRRIINQKNVKRPGYIPGLFLFHFSPAAWPLLWHGLWPLLHEGCRSPSMIPQDVLSPLSHGLCPLRHALCLARRGAHQQRLERPPAPPSGGADHSAYRLAPNQRREARRLPLSTNSVEKLPYRLVHATLAKSRPLRTAQDRRALMG